MNAKKTTDKESQSQLKQEPACAEKQNQMDLVPKTFIIKTIPSGTSDTKYGDAGFVFFVVCLLCISLVFVGKFLEMTSLSLLECICFIHCTLEAYKSFLILNQSQLRVLDENWILNF